MLIRSWIRILDCFSTCLSTAEKGILGDLLAFLTHPLADFHKIWQNDWHQQGNESITFWEQSSGYLDLDQPGNPDWINPASLLVEATKVLSVFRGVRCNRYWWSSLIHHVRPKFMFDSVQIWMKSCTAEHSNFARKCGRRFQSRWQV